MSWFRYVYYRKVIPEIIVVCIYLVSTHVSLSTSYNSMCTQNANMTNKIN